MAARQSAINTVTMTGSCSRIPQRSEIRLLIRHFEVKKSAMVGNLVW